MDVCDYEEEEADMILARGMCFFVCVYVYMYVCKLWCGQRRKKLIFLQVRCVSCVYVCVCVCTDHIC